MLRKKSSTLLTPLRKRRRSRASMQKLPLSSAITSYGSSDALFQPVFVM